MNCVVVKLTREPISPIQSSKKKKIKKKNKQNNLVAKEEKGVGRGRPPERTKDLYTQRRFGLLCHWTGRKPEEQTVGRNTLDK